MKWGLICRADNRGLGILTWEIYRHLDPERVLVIRELGAERKGFAPYLDRYPGATVAEWTGGLDEQVVRRWLRGLDLVWTAETPYDYRLYEWAREAGARSVCMAMPEFWHDDLPAPDVVWLPTSWRAEHFPQARLVPVPVAAERFSPRVRSDPVFLHLVGHRAARDRAGTTSLAAALRQVRSEFRLIVASQDHMLPVIRVGRGVRLEVRKGGVANYWDSYADASLLVAPRRYGGLSLPFGEAAAAGLGLLLSDTPPNREWPAARVPARYRGTIGTAAGPLPLADADPTLLARALDRLAGDPVALGRLSQRSLAWAQERSWAALLPLWRDELDRALA